MRFIKKLFLLIFIIALIFPTSVFAGDDVTVTINGQAVVFADQGPIIVDGRTLVPVAGVFQTLGFEVQWDGETQQATLTRANDMVVITIGSSTFTTNGVDHELDVYAQIIGSRTMLPIAAVLKSVGHNVDWDDNTRTVLVSSVPGDILIIQPPAPPVRQEVQFLVGTWIWDGIPYYVFNADGTGLMYGESINWTVSSGILSICITPDTCGEVCFAPAVWYYILIGNELTLTSTVVEDMVFTYTRG